jgi:hypothetical protein
MPPEPLLLFPGRVRGRRVAFFARAKLQTAAVAGGAPTPIADASANPTAARGTRTAASSTRRSMSFVKRPVPWATTAKPPISR